MKVKACRVKRKHFNKAKLKANANRNSYYEYAGRMKIARFIDRALKIEHTAKPNPMKAMAFGVKRALYAPK